MTEVSQTILAQLGGNKFIAMTAASKFVGESDSLSFRIPTAKSKINAIRIKLDLASDTYTVSFHRILGTKITDISSHAGVYVDMLQSLFTQETGLYTRL